MGGLPATTSDGVRTLLVVLLFTLLPTPCNAITKLRLDITTGDQINIIFGEENVLSFDLELEVIGNQVETGEDLEFFAFLSSEESGSIMDPTKRTDNTPVILSSEQKAMPLNTSSLDNEVLNTYSDVEVALNFTGVPGCFDQTGSSYDLICIVVDGTGELVNLLIPDTYCLFLDSCKSVITIALDGGPSVTSNAHAGLDVIYGTLKDFTLDISVETDDANKTANMTAAFEARVFLAVSDNGTSGIFVTNASLVDEYVDVEPDAMFFLTGLTATMDDLSGLNCDIHTHVCVLLGPAKDADWQWGTGTGSVTACAELNCTSEIEADPPPTMVSHVGGNLDIVMGIIPESFNLNISITTGHATAQIYGDVADLFSVDIYLANTENGTGATAVKTEGDVTPGNITVSPDVDSGINLTVINVRGDVYTFDLNCDDYSYVCVDINSRDTEKWTWSGADTDAKVACTEIDTCEANITADVSVTTNGGGNLDIVMGRFVEFVLDIEIDVDDPSAVVDAHGIDMFSILIYLGDDITQSTAVNATNISTDHVILSADVGATVLSGIQGVINTDGLSCENFDYVCVDIGPKTTYPSEPWNWSDGSLMKTACIQFDSCVVQVTNNTIYLRSSVVSDLNIIMGTTDKVFSLEMSIRTDIATGEITDSADNLFEVDIYLSHDQFGANSTIKYPTTITPVEVTIDTTSTTRDITVTKTGFDLTGLNCDTYIYICIDVSPRAGSKWSWTYNPGTAQTACVPLGVCTSSITENVITLSATDLNILMGTRKHFELTVVISVIPDSAEVIGNADDLFELMTYVSSTDGTTTSTKVSASIPSTVISMMEDEATTIDDVGADIDLNNLPCATITLLCVDVVPRITSGWKWSDDSPLKKVCVGPLLCSSQIQAISVAVSPTSGTDLHIIMGTSKVYDLNIVINTGPDTSLINGAGDDLFSVSFYLFQSHGQHGITGPLLDATVSSDVVTVQPNSATMLLDVSNPHTPDDLLGLECGTWDEICVSISPALGSGWKWTLNIAKIDTCTAITGCQTLMNLDEMIVSASDGSSHISIAMGSIATLVVDVTISTASTLTGLLSGRANTLFQMHMYLAANDDGTGNSPKVEARVPHESLTLADASRRTIEDVEADLDLRFRACADFSYTCVDVTPASPDWSWHGTTGPMVGCVRIAPCVSSSTIGVTVAGNSAGNLALTMGTTKTFHLDVTITKINGDDVSGSDLYVVKVFLASSESGLQPFPSRKKTAIIADNTVGFSTGTPALLNNVMVSMNFKNKIYCQRSNVTYFTHICVDVIAKHTATPSWAISEGSTTEDCVPLTSCQSQPLLRFTIDGLDIRSSEDMVAGNDFDVILSFEVTVMSSATSSNSDEWLVNGFLATSSTGSGATDEVQVATPEVSESVTQSGNTETVYTFTDLEFTIPAESRCGGLSHFCVSLAREATADWYFDAFDPLPNVKCTPITCSTDTATTVTYSAVTGLLGLILCIWFNN